MTIQFSIIGLLLDTATSRVVVTLQSVAGDRIIVGIPSNSPAVATLTIGRLVDVTFAVV